MKCFILIFLVTFSTADDCISRDYGNGGTVCVCNSSNCDTIPKPEKLPSSQFVKYTSNQEGLRFHKDYGTFTQDLRVTTNEIRINSDIQYQLIIGFGGAFTDATGINIQSLDEKTQDILLRAYYSEDGLEYNLGRVPIGGTDFSTRAYTYDDYGYDPNLHYFTLAPEDFKYKIPFIKKALNLTENNMQLFASAWSSPTWMKTNGKFTGIGFIFKEMYQIWADYHLKFLESYQKEDISFWGITTGNEPNACFVPFDPVNSLCWNPTTLSEYIKNNLGPTLRNSQFSNIKIMTLDDQRLFLPWYVDLLLSDNTTRGYIDGIAVHWYFDEYLPTSWVNDTHNHFPDKFILGTEACAGSIFQPVALGSWDRAEKYAIDIIGDLDNFVTGWTDWNMALNLNGGPTYVNNAVDSPIIVNATAQEFYKQPTFYIMGHFSKFVKRNSIRIYSSQFKKDLLVVAFKRMDNATVVILLNTESTSLSATIVDPVQGSATLELTAKSITTVLYW